jgi:hypothetical protein
VRTPQLSRLVETFIQVGEQTDLSPDRHFHLLRTEVAPLVSALRERELVGWFSDHAVYLHLRLELLPGATLDALRDALPPACILTRMAPPVDERSLFPADHEALVAPEVSTGWALLGASAEWALDFACAHRDDRPLPLQNLSQFLHYLGNQLLVRTTNIPMP